MPKISSLIVTAGLIAAQSSFAQFNLNNAKAKADASKEPVTLYSGVKDGVYFNNFAPAIVNFGADKGLTVVNTEGRGSLGNIKAVAQNPNSVAITQADVLKKVEATDPALYDQVQILGMVSEECMFAVTNKVYAEALEYNFGNVVMAAAQMAADGQKMNIASGDANSGSRGTWNVFAKGGPLEDVNQVDKEASKVLDSLQKADGSVHIGFFVRYPLTTNSLFKEIYEKGLVYIPVVHPVLEDIKIGQHYVYTKKEGDQAPIVYGGRVPTTCVQDALIANSRPANPKITSVFIPAIMDQLSPVWTFSDRAVRTRFWATSLINKGSNLLNDYYEATKKGISRQTVNILSGR